jgi:hypothetical protein
VTVFTKISVHVNIRKMRFHDLRNRYYTFSSYFGDEFTMVISVARRGQDVGHAGLLCSVSVRTVTVNTLNYDDHPLRDMIINTPLIV